CLSPCAVAYDVAPGWRHWWAAGNNVIDDLIASFNPLMITWGRTGYQSSHLMRVIINNNRHFSIFPFDGALSVRISRCLPLLPPLSCSISLKRALMTALRSLP
ncbi:hypothetical protein, partial [uncultured Cobetia sp.]|uniref:hypothetical protein n=1 Tax=uncultured Cobetia sp. TaxID=410706 RepID=UPI002591EB3D